MAVRKGAPLREGHSSLPPLFQARGLSCRAHLRLAHLHPLYQMAGGASLATCSQSNSLTLSASSSHKQSFSARSLFVSSTFPKEGFDPAHPHPHGAPPPMPCHQRLACSVEEMIQRSQWRKAPRHALRKVASTPPTRGLENVKRLPQPMTRPPSCTQLPLLPSGSDIGALPLRSQEVSPCRAADTRLARKGSSSLWAMLFALLRHSQRTWRPALRP